MPVLPTPLPTALGDVFSVARAREAGVSRARTRARDLESPFRGVRRPRHEEPSLPDGPLAIDRVAHQRVLRDARAFAEIMSPRAFFAGRTAAVLLGLPVEHGEELEIGVFPPDRGPRRSNVRARRVSPGYASLRTVDGLRVTSPASTWAMLGADLSERDLIRLGDAVVRIPRDAHGRSRSERRLGSLAELRAAIDVGRRAGGGRLRLAVERVREGDPHRTDRRQWTRDIEKHAAYAAVGYETVRLTGVQLREQPARAVALVRDALLRHGCPPSAACGRGRKAAPVRRPGPLRGVMRQPTFRKE